MPEKTKQQHPRTIDEALLKQWNELRRVGDSKALAKELGVSKVTMDNALIYGHVNQQRLIDGINEYFKARIIREKQQAEELKNLNAGHVAPDPEPKPRVKRTYVPPANPVDRDPDTGKFQPRTV